MKLPLATLLTVLICTEAYAHGDVTPQAMDTSSLPTLGDEWLEENPWRDPNGDVWLTAVAVGDSGYNQNCARCHGLAGISGGIAPDLRLLSADWDGDEWFVERFRNGMTQNGITKMPAFENILTQEAAWAIRTYIETRPADDAFKQYNTRLLSIRDQLATIGDGIANGDDPAAYTDIAEQLSTELMSINDSAKTASKAPKAESPVSRAALVLNGTPESYTKAAESLTIGLSAAR